MNRNKSMTRPPKFDTAQLNSPAYYQYFTMVFDREAKKSGNAGGHEDLGRNHTSWEHRSPFF